jgi:hypothetical protein
MGSWGRFRSGGALVVSLAVGGAALSASPPARAQDSPRATAAEQLFLDARALMAQHRFKEACEKFASSQKLDPAVGTLLSLGDCNMGQGKTASAWLSYRRAFALANERKDPRNVAADERSNAAELQLSRLVLRLAEGARAADVQIAVNGDPLEPDVIQQPMPLDPGPATIVVSAPGYRTWSTHVHIGAIGDTVSVVIPPLEPLPDPAEVAREHARATTRRTIGLVTGGAGLVTIGVGAVLGAQAIVKIHQANQLCGAGPGTTCGNVSAVQESNTGKTFADAATVLIPVGVVLAGVGSYLYLTTKSERMPAVSADVASNGARVRLEWAW